MRTQKATFAILASLVCTSVTSIAQAPIGCILEGDRIPTNTRIYDYGNVCGCNGQPPDVLLHLLHSHQPTLKLTSNPAGECLTEHDGVLSLHYMNMNAIPPYIGTKYSALEQLYDFSLVSRANAGNLILATRNHEKAIKFSTTPVQNAPDIERARITPEGHVGIWTMDPKELFQVGPRMTFHVGSFQDFIGYNTYMWADLTQNPPVTQERTIVPNRKPLKIGLTSNGVLEIGAGNPASNAADAGIDWYEGTNTFDRFAGLTMSNTSGNTSVSIGRYWPSQNTRLTVVSFGSTNATNSLLAMNSNGTQLMRLSDDGKCVVGASSTIRERFQVGDLITFHDGGSKFIGFNAYYDQTQTRTRNIENDRISVALSIGVQGTQTDYFRIGIDKRSDDGQLFTDERGIMLLESGLCGVGETSPLGALHVRSQGLTSSTKAFVVSNQNSDIVTVTDDKRVGISVDSPTATLSIKGSGNTSASSSLNVDNSLGATMLLVRNDGRIGIGTTSPDGKLHVNGDVVIGEAKSNATTTGFANVLSVDGIVLSREVRVSAQIWPDYVFRPGYELKQISDVKRYVMENGHLEGVPTEKDVETEGVNVGEMQATLLRKIEELTLYVISLSERNERLEHQLEKLKQSLLETR